jgi:hypothetical protein
VVEPAPTPPAKSRGSLSAGSFSRSARHLNVVFALKYRSPSSVSTGSAMIFPNNFLRSRADIFLSLGSPAH